MFDMGPHIHTYMADLYLMFQEFCGIGELENIFGVKTSQ